MIMLNRDSERATKAFMEVQEIASNKDDIKSVSCDLSSFKSVISAIKEIKSSNSSINVLCNNAAVMAMEDIATEDG